MDRINLFSSLIIVKQSDLFTCLELYCFISAEDLSCKIQIFVCLLYTTKLRVLSILQPWPINGFLID